ncbi:protein kinase [Acinetobacter pseudolwoffii]|nr:bifunctional protein-serine/threonine kinase/phosphatase [Acinetobacter sp. YH12151]
MNKKLKISIGQYSSAGIKAQNQDFYGIYIPEGHALSSKGIACAIADGISSSNVSHIAAETAVSSFLSDYYSTSDAWSTQTSAARVIRATNSWLYAQTQQSQGRFDKDHGYVCTLSALILKQNRAHIFHAGDGRVYRIQAQSIEQLTIDHRVRLSSTEHYLSRALGVDHRIEVDYQQLELCEDDLFLLMTDGVYEFIDIQQISDMLQQKQNLDTIAQSIVELALKRGSDDNLTIQIIRIDALAQEKSFQIQENILFPQQLSHGDLFEGYRIHKILHQNHRSSLYLAQDAATQAQLVIKTLSVDLQDDLKAVEQFQLEDWVSKRLKHENLMHYYPHTGSKKFLFQSYEYLQGESLNRWLHRQKTALSLKQLIPIIEQVAKALNAMHRLEMLHQDVRPENVMLLEPIDALKVKLIDYGSTAVRGLVELNPKHADVPLGTLAFMAPEYFIGRSPSVKSDQFSLAVMSYYLLTRQLPYGTELARCKTEKKLKKVRYHSLSEYRPDLPKGLDAIFKKALSIRPEQRYEALSAFIYDLKQPDLELKKSVSRPVIERHPLTFWKCCTAILFILLLLVFSLYFMK